MHPNRKKLTNKHWAARGIYVLLALALCLSLAQVYAPRVIAANPAPYEIYFVPLPDDWLMQHMEDIDNNSTTNGEEDPYPPVRDVIGITISTDSTLIYYDQWEPDSGTTPAYDADIANPADLYSAGNPNGTQIWGDGDLTNGCPPRFRDITNPCAAPADDTLQAGDVIVLDNNVPITSSGTQQGPWLGGRGSAPTPYFDGMDKFGATYPVAATRAGWSVGDDPTSGVGPAGAMFSDATAIEPTSRWGTSFVTPVGINTTGFGGGQAPDPSPDSALDYAHVTVQAQQDGTTVCVDVPPHTAACNGAGDNNNATTINQGQQYDPTTMPNTNSPQGVPHGTEVRTNYPVQVILITGDVGSTWATRWYNLKPRPNWYYDYYTPVGTSTASTAVWIYNPSHTFLGNYRDIFGNTAYNNSNGSKDWSVNSWQEVNEADGASAGDVQITGGQLRIGEDDNAGIYRMANLTGATTATFTFDFSENSGSGSGDTLSIEQSTNGTTWSNLGTITQSAGSGSRSYNLTISATTYIRFIITNAWEANEFVYIDNVNIELISASSTITVYYDHLGGASPDGNITVAAGASVKFNNIPAGSGARYYTTGSPAPVFYPVSVTEYTGAQIYDWGYAPIPADTLTDEYLIGWAPGCATASGANECNDADDDDTVQSRSVVWVTPLATTTVYIDLDGGGIDCPGGGGAERSLAVTALTSYTIFDDPGLPVTQGDFDMSGTRLRSCDGTLFATAWGQDPAKSYSGDDEGLDMGAAIFPLGSNIIIDKTVNTPYVTPGGQVTYTYDVRTTRAVPLSSVTVNDNYCSPATLQTKSGGDQDDLLEINETWTFTCTASIFVDTINIAIASGIPDGGSVPIYSAPDQARVRVGGAIGDTVWVDEDGDGDQDGGEPGIPNVKVTLSGTDLFGNPVSRTTYTDSNGNYVFHDLPPSNASGYTVTVDTTTLPVGLAANQTYDPDATVNNSTTVVLNPGIEWMTADFGYNWASIDATNDPDAGENATGAIGDRVWIDANGDGIQDDNEAGLGGVTVELWWDSDNDGDIDSLKASTTTDAAGNYIFDGLAKGIYEVRVTGGTVGTQSGDPDEIPDGKTTDPIVLGPGDVFLNADFGYQPASSSDIGDTIYLDSNGDGNEDAGEPGIAGVSVALILDDDGDGVPEATDGNGVWDPGEPIIATDITDETGQYLFPGLPAGNYIVWVNDTDNVLNELDVKGDPQGALDGLSAVTVDGTNDNLDQDFGYAPPGHASGEGMIGDTIYLDSDGGGDFDPGEGLEGVVVRLYSDTNGDGNYDSGEPVVARTVTDENGNYSFGNLPAGNYVVMVDTNSLPAGVTNTVDPDTTSSPLNESGVTLAAGTTNLLQDFGYADTSSPNSVGGTLWVDTDADGVQDAGETAEYPGVSVDLYIDSNGDGVLGAGDELVGTIFTDSNGHYNFGGLPDGTYFVDVSDVNNVLNGTWHSLGTQGEADEGQSKIDAYKITLSGGENRDTVDFGYFIEPAAIGNFVWNDRNGDGIQDPDGLDNIAGNADDEVGILGIEIILTITWPDGTTTKLVDVTDSSGYYEFPNLLMDEDYDGAGGGEPTYSLSINPATIPPEFISSPSNLGGNDNNDSDDPAGAPATATRGATNINNTIDFGLYDPYPTGVTVVDFVANYISVNTVKITWTAVDSTDVAYYNIYRSGTPNVAQRVKINAQPIPVDLDNNPANYEYYDENVATQTWYYWLAKIVTPYEEILMEDVPYATAVYRGVKMYLPITTK